MTPYSKAYKRLTSLPFAKFSRMDLAAVSQIYDQLNIPNFFKVHVGGTNGKGSCVYKLSDALTLSGYRTARFTSPHVSTLRERIQIDGEMISETEAARLINVILDLAKHKNLEITFFETLFLVAMMHFANQSVDCAVIEVGLGGRLDATNCIQPSLTIITSISLDHTHILGETLDAIAFEKAGIIKDKTSLITGPSACQKIFAQRAEEKQACHIALKPRVHESYDEENQRIALSALGILKKHFQISEHAINQALMSKPKARYEELRLLNHQVILDMAHNEEGLKRFFKEVNEKERRSLKVVFTAMALNHDYAQNLKVVEKYADVMVLLKVDHPRLAPVDTLQKALSKKVKVLFPHEVPGWVKELKQPSTLIFVGSIFIMQDVYELLGYVQEKDPSSFTDGLFREIPSFQPTG